MTLKFSHAKDKEKTLKSALRILEHNKLLTLSTIDKKQPCSSTAYYVFDKSFNLHIWGEKTSLHFKNIKKNKKVAINIFDSMQKWGSLMQGLQAFGNASIANKKELIKAGLRYMKRFPGVLKFVKTPKDFHSKIFKSGIYKIQLNNIKILDEKIFGKEEFRSIVIRR